MFFSTQRAFGQLIATAIACSVVTANAQTTTDTPSKTVDDPTSLIWMLGTVTEVVDGQASIDLGDAHGLQFGDRLAVFRRTDSHYEPLGILTLEDTHPVHSIARTTERFEPQTDDRVITCRTLAQLGTIEEFRDRFLKRQILARSGRNGYSNLQLSEEASVLHRFTARQPKWTRSILPVAGAVRSASLDSAEMKSLQPLLEQILHTRELGLTGVPVNDVVSVEWQIVLEVIEAARTTEKPDRKTVGEGTKPESEASEPVAEATEIKTQLPIEPIQRHINDIMFTRSKEERNAAALVCTALEHFTPRYEQLFVTQQLKHTQFVELAEDGAWLKEFEKVMQKVRQEKK